MRTRALVAALVLAALALYLAFSSIYVINEGEQALVVRLGAPVDVVDRPGLKLKAPSHRPGLCHLDPLAPARAAGRAGDHGRPEAPRGAALCALSHRRSAALLPGAAHARGGERPARPVRQLLGAARARPGAAARAPDGRARPYPRPRSRRRSRRRPSRSASRSTRSASIAPTCRSRPARRSTTG